MSFNVLEKYPKTVQYFGIDQYIDPSTSRIIRLSSTKKWSYESRVNAALSAFEKNGSTLGYADNRLREQIACLIFTAFLNFNQRTELSTMINDIVFKVDAIVNAGGYMAIDFTQNFDAVNHKLTPSLLDGTVPLLTPNGNEARLPFMVVYISSGLISHVLNEVEMVLGEIDNLKFQALKKLCSQLLEEGFQNDARPDLLMSFHTYSQSQPAQIVSQKYATKIAMYSSNRIKVSQSRQPQ